MTRHSLTLRSFVSSLAICVTACLVLAPGVQSRGPQGSIFEMPRVHRQVQFLRMKLRERAAAGELRVAEDIARQIVVLLPEDADAHFDLARLEAATGRTAPAVRSLKEAVRLGFRNIEQLRNDPLLSSLRGTESFQQVVEEARTPFVPPADSVLSAPTPGQIRDGVALVTEENTRWNRDLASLVIAFADPEPSKARTPTAGDTEAARLVNDWFAEGTAAGNTGDLYDNLDKGHSLLALGQFPQMTRVQYSEEARNAKADYTIQTQHLFNRPTLGNSSTAQTGGPFWRSNPRMAMIDGFQVALLYNQYVHNHLYVYPEHADYDAPRGDVYPVNFPYCVISQGSSGSDRPFLSAIATTLAAFRPEAKEKLIRRGQLMSTVQLILRRCQNFVLSDEDYLNGRAHPIVFQSEFLDVERMVRMAHAMTEDNLPPMIQLSVVEEDLGDPAIDYFYAFPAERLADTPAVIARVYRTTADSRRMVVDASATVDPNDRDLAFHWVLLQGDPERVTIVPQGDGGSRAEITLRWHPTHPVAHRPDINSNRIDIGVFADNGTWISAPGFITSFSLACEKREYDADGRIRSVDYGDPVVSKNYVDPFLDLRKTWRDDYHYADDGTLKGWTRTSDNESPQEFHHDGTLVLMRDELGRPIVTSQVRYGQAGENGQPARLTQEVIPPVFRYTYASDQDFTGQKTVDAGP